MPASSARAGRMEARKSSASSHFAPSRPSRSSSASRTPPGVTRAGQPMVGQMSRWMRAGGNSSPVGYLKKGECRKPRVNPNRARAARTRTRKAFTPLRSQTLTVYPSFSFFLSPFSGSHPAALPTASYYQPDTVTCTSRERHLARPSAATHGKGLSFFPAAAWMRGRGFLEKGKRRRLRKSERKALQACSSLRRAPSSNATAKSADRKAIAHRKSPDSPPVSPLMPSMARVITTPPALPNSRSTLVPVPVR